MSDSNWLPSHATLPVHQLGPVKHERRDSPPPARNGLRHTFIGPWKVSTVDLDLRRIDPSVADRFANMHFQMLGTLGGRFETMVFGNGWDSLDCERYATETEALAGHDLMVSKWSTIAQGDDGQPLEVSR